ncbi:hypothetical protein B0H12DRAFT_1131088 [Mycena haematopus]|nr:hypothetical protein B0H12DRAFT_1131088 [Mycena haematopus]
MYHGSSIMNSESPGASVASILGIKGGLRIRPHTIHQKAHAVLRRVELSEESSDDGRENNIVVFKLFAAKPINLKPGKELLLTVASVDGRFKDQNVIFEGNFGGFDEDSEGTTQAEEEPQVIEEEEEEIIPEAVMPPKMRRQWTKRVEEVSQVVYKVPVAHLSVGVQVQPIYTSSSVQAISVQNSVSVQVQPSQGIASVQTSSSYASSAIQTDPPPPPIPSYNSMDVQTDPISSIELSGLAHIQPTPCTANLAEATCRGYSSSITVRGHGMSPKETILPSDVLADPSPPRPHDSPHPRALPRNPFVSGGFVIDFVGAVQLARAAEPLIIDNVLANPSTDGVALKASTANNEGATLRDVSTPTHQSLVRGPVLSMQAPQHIRPQAQNAHAPLISISPRAPPEAAEKQQQRDDIWITPSSSEPPPEPQTIARIPAGPSSNPLNIRPSNLSLRPTPAPSYAAPAPKAKKPLVVGRGWPFVRAVKPTSIVSTSKYHLNSISANPPINSELSVNVTPNDDSLVDMVISEPPSPVNGPSSLPGASASISSESSSEPQTLTTVLDHISSDIHDQIASLEETRTATVSLLSRISPRVGESPVVVPTSSSRTFPSLLARISPDIGKVNPPPAVSSTSSSHQTPATSSQINPVQSSAVTPPQQHERLSPVITPANAALLSQVNSVLHVNSGDVQRNSSPVQLTQTADVPPPASTPRTSGLTTTDSTAKSRRSLHHPLPAKPPPPVPPNNPRNQVSYNSPRGIKRECPSPDLWTPRTIKRECRSPDLWTAQDMKHKCPSSDLWTAEGIKRECPPSDLWNAQGMKRESPPPLWAASVIVRAKPQRRWPTVEWTDSDVLMGTGDVGIRRIVFNSDGSYFALSCMDMTLRIWNSKTRLEIARLSHNSQVIGLAWLDEATVMSLDEDGELRKWAKIGQQSQWQWARVITVDAEDRAPGDTVCLACARDRIAIAFPKTGVKVWIWCKGSWRPQRSIMRKNVTALKFIDGGDALLGGTREGVVWHCAVPNGTMKVYTFLQSSITSISIGPPGKPALITQASGSACLVTLGLHDDQRVRQHFLETDLHDGSVGAIFSAQGKTVVFGSVDGCLLVWDTQKGTVLYGMEHPDADLIQAVASCDGPRGGVVAGTRHGRLLWLEPETLDKSPSNSSRKRLRVE